MKLEISVLFSEFFLYMPPILSLSPALYLSLELHLSDFKKKKILRTLNLNFFRKCQMTYMLQRKAQKEWVNWGQKSFIGSTVILPNAVAPLTAQT